MTRLSRFHRREPDTGQLRDLEAELHAQRQDHTASPLQPPDMAGSTRQPDVPGSPTQQEGPHDRHTRRGR